MIRPLTLLCMVAAGGAGLYLYQVKHQVALLDRELRELHRGIEQARERTAVLRAEWALLNEPERLRQVAQRHLPLEPLQPQQFIRLTDLDRRVPPPVVFAGAPSLFAPPPGTEPNAAVAVASATPPAESSASTLAPGVMLTAARLAAAQSRPGPAASEATTAARRSAPDRPRTATAQPSQRPSEPAEAPAAPPAATVRPAVHIQPLRPSGGTGGATQRVIRAESATGGGVTPRDQAIVSVLGSIGRPSLAPPVPITGSALAGTLDGRGAASPAPPVPTR